MNVRVLDRSPIRRLQPFELVLTVLASVVGLRQPAFADEPLRYTLTGPSKDGEPHHMMRGLDQ